MLPDAARLRPDAPMAQLPAAGGFHLLQGDALEQMAQLPAGSVDAVITDPPYGAQLHPDAHAWDVWPDPAVWTEIARVLTPTGILAVTIAPHLAHARIPDVLAAGFQVLEVLFWVSGNGRPVYRTRLKRCYDLVYLMSRQGRHLFPDQARGAYRAGQTPARRRSGILGRTRAIGGQFAPLPAARSTYQYGRYQHPANVACPPGTPAFGAQPHYEQIFAIPRARGATGLPRHPTAKPLSLLVHLVQLLTPPGGCVLDPFCGGGTTGEAALLTGRRFLGIEGAVRYVALARARLTATLGDLQIAHRPPPPPPRRGGHPAEEVSR